jgi:DNA-binding MarR family transcriptional regulator
MNDKELLTRFEHGLLVIFKEMHEAQRGVSECSPAQNYVLIIIGMQGAMRVKQLAEVLRVTSGAVTQHIDVLEKAGLLARTINPENRREVVVDITPEGKSTYQAIRRAKLRMLNELFSGLDDDERATLTRLIEKISHKYIENKEQE